MDANYHFSMVCANEIGTTTIPQESEPVGGRLTREQFQLANAEPRKEQDGAR
jgi:hypothetical protein